MLILVRTNIKENYMSKLFQCKDCIYLITDNRVHVYRAEQYYFCKKKGSLHSRNYKIGEGTRILPSDKACEQFLHNEKTNDRS